MASARIAGGQDVSEWSEPVVLTFGAGINAQKRSVDIDDTECSDGQNFDLNFQQQSFKRRRAFDLVGTATNGLEIRGFAQLVKRNGTITTLVQAGQQVYSWNGSSTFTAVGTVSPATKMRGPRSHNSLLDEFVIITDLNKATILKKWDGTSFTDFDHSLTGTSVYAKYCRIHKERAFFANVTAGSATPHIILASEIGAVRTLSSTNRPSSALGLDSAFFLPSLDLRPINGLEQAFGAFFISTESGSLQQLSGENAFDFKFESLYEGSAIAGAEAMVGIGNDVLFGLPGRIESLSGTLEFGDVQTDDVSLWITPFLANTTSWTLVYDRRTQKVFCFPNDQAACYVFHKSLWSKGLESPSMWSRWVTDHAMGFQPTAIMAMLDPVSSQEVVYAGDLAGRIFLLDGRSGQDGGNTDLSSNRISKIFRLPDAQVFDIEGHLLTRKEFSATVTLTFQFAGSGIFDQAITIPLTANTDFGVYDDASADYSFYNDRTFYSSAFSGRLSRYPWRAAGQASHAQLKVEVEGANEFEIDEISFRFRAARG